MDLFSHKRTNLPIVSLKIHRLKWIRNKWKGKTGRNAADLAGA